MIDRYSTDAEFARIVIRVVDEIHAPETYKWVNRKALGSFNYSLRASFTLETLTQDHPNYQVFVDSQVHFLRDITIAVMSRM